MTDITTALVDKPVEEAIQYLLEQYPGAVAFSTSFGQEDQVIIRYYLA